MGRKTYESIGKPLPGRLNIMLTRNMDELCGATKDIHKAVSLAQALSIAQHYSPGKEIFIIGGGEIYKEALPLVDTIYMTIVDAKVEGDTHFPEINRKEWNPELIQTQEVDKKHKYSFSIFKATKHGKQ